MRVVLLVALREERDFGLKTSLSHQVESHYWELSQDLLEMLVFEAAGFGQEW